MADEKKTEKPAAKKRSSENPVAKKDHVLHQNENHFEITKGEPLPDGIPPHLMVALKTEGVID
jgi:hypothetical protein